MLSCLLSGLFVLYGFASRFRQHIRMNVVRHRAARVGGRRIHLDSFFSDLRICYRLLLVSQLVLLPLLPELTDRVSSQGISG